MSHFVTCPRMSTDPGSLNPDTRRSWIHGWWDPGIRTNTGADYTVWQNILNLYYSRSYWKSFSYPLMTLWVRGTWWVAAESGDLWSWTLYTTHYYQNYQYFCIQYHWQTYRGDKTELDKFWWGCHTIPYNLHLLPVHYCTVGKYCILCDLMLDGAYYHETPWKPGLFTSWLWSGHCSRLALPAKQWWRFTF